MPINQVQIVAPRSEHVEKKQKKSDIEKILEGLQVAQGITGIAVNVQTIRDRQGSIEQRDQEMADKAVKDMDLASERARFAEGRLNKGEQIELGQKGFVQAEPGQKPDFFGKDSETGGPLGYVRKETGLKVKPPDERLAFDREKFEYQKQRDKSEAAERAQARAASAGKTKAGGPDPNASYEQRLSGLNAEERKRLDSASMGLNAVQEMGAALKNGDNTISILGDNDFTLARRNFEEALGRMQSGGAINSDEASRFAKMAPGPLDSAEMQQKKLDGLAREMSLRVQNLGFKPEEVMGARQAVSGVGKSAPADVNGMGLPGNNSTAAAGVASHAPGTVIEYEGAQYTVGPKGELVPLNGKKP